MWEKILPKNVNNEYHGSRLASMVFLLLAVVSMGRSLIHLLAPDGGAATIAGIDLSQGGAASIIFAFGLWGLSQVIYAFLQLLVALRYKKLLPLMFIILIFETVGRIFVGKIKPPILLHTPPGGIANYFILPLAALMLVLSLRERKIVKK
ncbi:MAG: hypothetical protein WCI30_06785 [Clostridia bacterium]